MIHFNPGVVKLLSLLVMMTAICHHVHADPPTPPDGVGIHYGDYHVYSDPKNTWWPGTDSSAALSFIHQNVGHPNYIRTWEDPIQCYQWQNCGFSDEQYTLQKMTLVFTGGQRVEVMATIAADSARALAAAQGAYDINPNSDESKAMDGYLDQLQAFINAYSQGQQGGAYLRYLAVSNEPDVSGDGYLEPNEVVQAVTYLKRKLQAPDSTSGVYLTVPFSYGVMTNTYPVQDGDFISPWSGKNGKMNDLLKVIDFFSINIYPYQTCAKCNPRDCQLAYCLGNGGNVNGYTSMFEAQLDATRAALNRVDIANGGTRGVTIPIAVTETGWATAGTDDLGTYAHPDNACYFNNWLLRWIRNGARTPGLWTSPPAPVNPQQVYFFEAFNEDSKDRDSDKYLGIYRNYSNTDNTRGACAYAPFGDMDWTYGQRCPTLPVFASAADSHHDIALKLSMSPATPQPNSVFDLKTTIKAQAPTAPAAAIPGMDAATAEATPAAAVDGLESDAAADGAVVEEAGALPQAGVDSVDSVAVAPQHGGTPPGARNVKVTLTLGSKASFVSVSVLNNQGSRAEGHLLVPANNNNGGSCSYKKSTHQVECSIPSLAYGSSKVVVIKLKPQAGYHEHHVMATSSHEGFLAEGGHPVTAYVAHRACHPSGSTSGGCSSATSANTCCSNTCVGRMVGRRMKYYCA